jgi:sterol desaturase/sphingolipid hydroxylase (fatty acid hydroxylase superfamily)
LAAKHASRKRGKKNYAIHPKRLKMNSEDIKNAVIAFLLIVAVIAVVLFFLVVLGWVGLSLLPVIVPAAIIGGMGVLGLVILGFVGVAFVSLWYVVFAYIRSRGQKGEPVRRGNCSIDRIKEAK